MLYCGQNNQKTEFHRSLGKNRVKKKQDPLDQESPADCFTHKVPLHLVCTLPVPQVGHMCRARVHIQWEIASPLGLEI